MTVESVGMDLLGEASALAKVIMIDVVLAGDNAVVVGMAAAGVAAHYRKRVIFYGIAIAVLMRIGFALIATEMLAIIGLTLAGGLLLLWVAWKMYREIRATGHGHAEAVHEASGTPGAPVKEKTFMQAMIQLVIADLSMSLDNVLAVAGAARDHLTALVIGLLLSIALMGSAASFIANYLTKWRWLTWAGLLIVVFVALDMIWRGTQQVACSGLLPSLCLHIAPAIGT